MTNRTVEKRNEVEQVERVEAQAKAIAHEAVHEAETTQKAIQEAIAVCDDSTRKLDSDSCTLASKIWDFLSQELHKILKMNSLKEVAENWADEDSVISSESSLRDFRDLGAVRDACSMMEAVEMPTKLQAGKILKKGFKVHDLYGSVEFEMRMRLFTEARATHPEIESARLAVTADECDGTIESVEASNEAEAEVEASKTDEEKCEIQFTNFLNAVQKLNAEDGKAKIAECKARMKLSDLEFTG
jgi:hypothetical protein